MGGFAAAWLVGVGIVSWREVHSSGHMPVPAALLGVTGLFAVLAAVGDASPQARPVVTMLAWGLDIAGLFNILPAGLFGQITAAENAQANAGTKAVSLPNPGAGSSAIPSLGTGGHGPGHPLQAP